MRTYGLEQTGGVAVALVLDRRRRLARCESNYSAVGKDTAR